MIEIYEQNTKGIDYICSDIHGYFHYLESELNKVDFNPLCDRLFSLGDLIDRGEQSYLAIDWLNKPWFHAILGNHELMFMDKFEEEPEGEVSDIWQIYGGGWASELNYQQLKDLFEAFRQLPVAIEINLSDKKQIGLVHAQLPNVCDWNEVKSKLQIRDSQFIMQNIDIMLWSKSQANLAEDMAQTIPPVKNIDHVFHGHTIISHYRTLANRTFMDLGSYLTGQIALVEPVTFLNGRSRN